MERDYRKEYERFHGRPAEIARRSARNKARRALGLEPGDPREADHKRPLANGGSNRRSNLRAVSFETNRAKGDKEESVSLYDRVMEGLGYDANWGTGGYRKRLVMFQNMKVSKLRQLAKAAGIDPKQSKDDLVLALAKVKR